MTNITNLNTDASIIDQHVNDELPFGGSRISPWKVMLELHFVKLSVSYKNILYATRFFLFFVFWLPQIKSCIVLMFNKKKRKQENLIFFATIYVLKEFLSFGHCSDTAIVLKTPQIFFNPYFSCFLFLFIVWEMLKDIRVVALLSCLLHRDKETKFNFTSECHE